MELEEETLAFSHDVTHSWDWFALHIAVFYVTLKKCHKAVFTLVQTAFFLMLEIIPKNCLKLFLVCPISVYVLSSVLFAIVTHFQRTLKYVHFAALHFLYIPIK